MASKPAVSLHLLITLIIFLALLSDLSVQSPAANAQEDFNKWVKWNLQSYREKKSSSSSSSSSSLSSSVLQTLINSAAGARWPSAAIDDKLQKAEASRVRISVRQDGNGDFTTITEALSSIPAYNTRRVVVAIGPGIYREKIAVPRRMGFITLSGDESAEPPTITGNDTASTTGKNGTPLRTFESATVAVDADYFVAINVNFQYVLFEKNTAGHEIGSGGGQAVALRISGSKAAFYNCSFYGAQDTLYDHRGLHYFYNCFIQGSVDFIFGYATSLYENCHLNSITKKVASITAQKRWNASMPSGFSFKNCSITGSGTVYLGRAWGDYARVVFSYTFMDKVVLPQGWSDWGDHKRDTRVFYGEYKCSGPGANNTRRVPWARLLSDEEAQPFLGTYYVDGASWLLTP